MIFDVFSVLNKAKIKKIGKWKEVFVIFYIVWDDVYLYLIKFWNKIFENSYLIGKLQYYRRKSVNFQLEIQKVNFFSDCLSKLGYNQREISFAGLIGVGDSKLEIYWIVQKFSVQLLISWCHGIPENKTKYWSRVLLHGTLFFWKLNLWFLGHLTGLTFCCFLRFSWWFQLIKVWINFT